MSKAVHVPQEEVYITSKAAWCDDCESGYSYYEDTCDEFSRGYDKPELKEYIGKPCKCKKGVYKDKTFTERLIRGGYFDITCNCSTTFQLHYDGQKCPKCKQMYNAVGQEIMFRGY